MSHRIIAARIEQIERELGVLEKHVAANPGEQREFEARFLRVRGDAVALCKTLPGAQVAAMQIGAAECEPRGIARLVGLLERVRHDVGDEDEHAA